MSENLDYAKVKKQIQVMTITGPLPGEKGDKKSVTITYEDPFDSSMNFTDWESSIDVQGTSSQWSNMATAQRNLCVKIPI